jgi:hypothetical protein
LRSKWLILVPAIGFALFAKPAKADVLGDWTYSQSCGTGSVEVVDNSIILHGPDGGGCQGPNWVKIVTTIPAGVNTVDFTWAYQTNDGAWYDPPQVGVNGVYTQLTMQSNATGSASISVNEGDIFTFRQYSTDSCCQPGHLTISNLSLWEFTTTSTTTTTTSTTTVPETTVPATVPTTTTVQETTTTTTSVENSTSTTSSSVPQTTSTVLTPTTTQPPVTLPPTPPQTTQPVPVETFVPTTFPETTTSTTSTTVVATTTTVTLPSSTTSTTLTSSIPPATTIAPQSPQTTLPAVLSVAEVTTLLTEAKTTEALVTALSNLAPEQVAQVVGTILSQEPTQEQATALAMSSEVLAVVSTQEAAQIFEALDVEQLSDAQTEQLISAVQDAPTSIRQTFEDKVDIFKSALDTYVPVGSNIPVGTRRTLIAVTAGITLAAAGTRIRR